ncbi:7facf1ac-f920-491b-a552-7b1c9d017295 [Sclerotinia trifoliorum]|uniref:7facf1ac-f920-491b-a552-7b1c9d017295 n=1 Tax=Sclerotinia trifoliorum TaxID=28548 RepID=A0A8H2VNA3_9HELO|nr:7facf1ac-f920-491b-a552-7b1c9d017295 [Sclerotinia trifoliorum]
MADNLCGPSNALQNFQKHSNVDRTLQQDRLVGRASPSQGFRTSSGPNAGQLDAEFAAFQAGHQSFSPSPSIQNFSPRHFQTSSPQSFQNPPPQFAAGQGWATDFQNMSISGPQAQFQQQGLHQTNQSQMGGGWHQEFAQSYGGSGSIAQGKQPVMSMNGPSMMNHGYNPMPRVLMQQNQLISTRQSSVENNEAFDDAAFARAFDEAASAEKERAREQEQELEITRAQQETAIVSEQANADQKAEFDLDRAESDLLNQAPLGADTIQDPAAATLEENTHATDALSRTAGELLSNVSDNQSDKFQNSQFLQLMRQFRDKEVTVEGDQVVGTPMKGKQGVYENRNEGEFHDMVGAP